MQNKQLTPQEQEIERCLKSFDHIEKVAAENPHISAREVVRRNQIRLANYRKKTTDAICSAFTEAVSQFREDFKVKIKPKVLFWNS